MLVHFPPLSLSIPTILPAWWESQSALKLGPTTLFTHLKIILLLYFQFSTISSIQTDFYYHCLYVLKGGLFCQNKLGKLYCLYVFLLSHFQSQQYFQLDGKAKFNLAKGQGCEISKSNKPNHSHLPKNHTIKITSYYETILT